MCFALIYYHICNFCRWVRSCCRNPFAHENLITAPGKGLKCNVKCYGQGKVHEDIVKQLSIARYDADRRYVAECKIPCVLFVYKVSREIEDFKEARQLIEMKEDLCAVVLLEKGLIKHDKPAEVYHGDVFDEKTVVVRILWKETWQWQYCPPSWKYCDIVQKGPRYQEAMDKVRESIKERQRE